MNPKLLGAFLVGIIVLTGVYIGSLTLKQPSTENIILDQQAQVGGSMPSGQVSYWNFDAGSGSGASDSVGNNTLSFVGSPTWVAGRFGQALSFSGTGAGLRDSSVSVSSSAVTAAFWLKNDSWGTSQTELIELSDNNNNSTSGFGIYANDTPSCSSGQISVVIKGDAGYNAACYATPGTGVWHHYAFVLDKSQGGSGEIKVYMDGSFQAPAKQLYSSDNTNSFSTNSLNVMTRSGEGSPTFAGIMDDLRFYSKALSSNEIGQLIAYTGEPVDSQAPTFSSISASSVTTTGANISWTTNESSDTQIEYGITTAYGSNTTLNSSLSTSHSQSLSGLQSGTLYHYRVKSRDASNNLGVSADQTFTTTAAANQAPTVSLALSATSVTAPGTVTLTASASDPDGSIARVEFYNGPARLDNDTTSPYTFTWTNIPVGTYTVSALAYDNKGLTGVSTLKTITVGTQPQSTYTVNVTKAGTGSGTVTSTGSINCGLTCSSTGNSGQSVTLTAAPAAGSTFSGWSGGTCSGTASTCTFTLNSNKTITASFTGTPITYSVTVTKSGAGSGTVTSTGSINCGTSCTANGTPGQTVTLTATPATGSTFAGWSGILGCSTSTTCSFNLNANTTINAIFNTAVSTYTVTTAKAGTGSGTVTCNPTSCSASTGGTVTVTATPSPGSIFLGWTGGCTGTGSCSLTSTGTVTATFNYIPQVDGTTFYVTPSGAGAKNGSDWNNAYGSLPATLVRGATYYLAGGSYSSYTFNTPESGTKVITIKKASPADHGTDAGWVSSYGTTQATFTSQFRVHRGNFVLDGQYRNENDWFDGLAYGLKIKHNNDFTHLIIRDENGTRNVNNVTIKYLYIAAQIGVLGSRPYAIDTDTYSSVIRNSGYVFSHDYVEGSNNPYFVRNTIDPLIEYSASSKTSGDAQYHGEVVNRFYSSNGVRGGGVIRYNHFRDSYNGASGYPKGGGTGVIAISETSGAEIYGNIFERYYVGDGAIAAGWANNNIKVYNNTFIDGVQGSGALVRFTATGAIVSGNVANNNLAINTANTTYNGDGTFDFNGTAPTAALINYAGGDYRLSQPTSITGRSLPSPFNLDRTGTIRGSVGIWDIGAYEYTGATQPPVVTITKSGTGTGTVTSTGSINCGSTCTSTGTNGQTVTLTATPSTTSTFGGWSGPCTGTTNPCRFTLNSNTTVDATFNPVVVPTNPSVTLTASPTSITSGQSSTLTWTPANVTSCTGTGGTFAGTKSITTGTQSVSPTSNTTYSISCTSSIGTTVSANVTVTVVPPNSGTTFYIRKGATGSNNGSSWANAWNELNQVNWASVPGGATVKIAGGTYTTPLSILSTGAGASATNRVTLQRATETGYNGKVTLNGWAVFTTLRNQSLTANSFIRAPYITIDGVDRSMFEFVNPGSNLMLVDINNLVDYFEIKNLTFKGTVVNNTSAFPLNIKTGSVFISGVSFLGQNGAEDIVNIESGGNNMRVENSYFTGWKPTPDGTPTGTHSDMMTYFDGGTYHASFIFKNNIVDQGTGYSDVFLFTGGTGSSSFGNVEISNNTFRSSGGQIWDGSAATTMKLVNNTFVSGDGTGSGKVNCGRCSSTEAKNNIFQGNYAGSSRINEGFTSTNSLWDIGALGYTSGTGNQQVPPQFTGSGVAVGADGIPFTADDSYQLKSTSPAVNAGVAVTGRTTDILGHALVGTPDIGAYEYTGTAVTPSSYTLSVTRSGNVAGSVSGAGVTCTTTSCNTVTVAIGTSATLTATAPANTTIVWTGCSTAVGNTCTIAANSVTAGNVKLVNADFSAITVTQPSMKFTSSPPDRVISTVAGLNVRSSPSTSASSLGLQNLNALGTILSNVSNGVYANGYYWWNINYDSPATGCVVTSTQNCKVGWSAENYLIKYDTPTTYTVTPAKAGTGSGTVTCNPTSCSATTGSSVTISAVPSAGSTFLGWSGCTSVAGNSCTKSAAGTVTATFNVIPVVGLTYTVTKGTMTNGSFSCNPVSCTQNAGSTITLTANPASGYQFSSWTGCTSITDTCTAYGAANVVATFIPRPTSVGNACSGTCYYVTVSGNGAKNGSDWNNAYAFSNVTSGTYQGLASSNMKRGATYYFSAGSYAAMALDDAGDGTKWIKLHKATAANSGSVAGWSSGLGAQTNLGYIALASDYYEIDGQTRNESKWNDDASYGFKTTSIIAHWDNFKPGADNIVIKNTSIGGKLNKPMTDTDFASGINVEGGPGGRSGYTIVNNYIHDTATPIWFSSGSNGFTIENNFIGASRGKEAIMGIYGGYNVIVRNNILVDNCQDNPYSTTANGCSAEITGFSASGQFNFDNWEVSGNLITRKNAKTTDHSDAAIAGGGTSSVTGWKVFNNVISSMYGAGLNRVHVKISAGGNNTAYNNVWYDIGGNGLTQTGCVATTCTNNITVTTDPYRYLSPAIKNQLPL